MPLVIGSGRFIPGFEDQLIGAKAGDEVNVNVTFPEDYQVDNPEGQSRAVRGEGPRGESPEGNR